MMKLAFVLVCGVLATANAAHVTSQQGVVRPQPAKGFSLASNRFGLDLLTQIGEQNDRQQTKQNIFFSPYSVALAMSMVQQGAHGKSDEQLRRSLRFMEDDVQLNGGDQQTIGQAIHDVEQRLHQQQQSHYQYDSGNAMVVDKQFQVKPDYVKRVQDVYDAQVITADYQSNPEQVKEIINQYVANKTHGMIDPMLQEAPSKDSRIALVNAVYFKGQWDKPFDAEKTINGVFYGHNGQQYQNVQYMQANQQYPYSELHGMDADMIMMDYKDAHVSFIGVLPRSRDADLSVIRKQLNASYIDQVISQMIRHQKSEVIIPKMQVESSYELVDVMKAIGVTDVFSSQADLSGISDDKVRIGKAIHKAKMIMNEEGTEASASTYIQIMVMSSLASEPKTFRFDHPYLYFIRHQSTGQILFIGEQHRF